MLVSTERQSARVWSVFPLCDDLVSNFHVHPRDVKLGGSQNEGEDVLGLLQTHWNIDSCVTLAKKPWMCQLVLASYCSNVLERKSVSSVMHGCMVHLCICCLLHVPSIPVSIEAPPDRWNDVQRTMNMVINVSENWNYFGRRTVAGAESKTRKTRTNSACRFPEWTKQCSWLSEQRFVYLPVRHIKPICCVTTASFRLKISELLK